jgi:integrase
MAGTWEKTKHPGIHTQLGANGKPRYRVKFRDSGGQSTSRTFPTITEAKDEQGSIRIRRRVGDLPDVNRGSRTLSRLWDEYAKKRETKTGEKIKPATWASYEHRWRNWIEPELGSRRLNALNTEDIEAFYDSVEKEGSFDTRRKVQQILHALLEFGVRRGWITKNPANIPQPGARPQREPVALTEAELEKVGQEIPEQYRALYWALAETGARPGELIALRVKHLNGNIRIVDHTVEVGGKKITGKPKTTKSIRSVPISPRLRRVLDEHFEAGYANRSRPESYVFTSENGSQVSQSNFRNRVLVPAAERAGIEGLTTYDLRHTRISIWAQKNVALWKIAKMTGTSVAMIEQRYGHLQEDEMQAEIDALG